RVHRADVDLVAVAAGRCRPVVPDRDRQEMEHQIRIGHVLVRPGEAAALEVVGGPWARSTEQPFRADHRPVVHLQCRCDADRLLARVLNVDLQVILQVLADAWQIRNDIASVLLSGTVWTYAAERSLLW